MGKCWFRGIVQKRKSIDLLELTLRQSFLKRQLTRAHSLPIVEDLHPHKVLFILDYGHGGVGEKDQFSELGKFGQKGLLGF